MAVTVEVEHPLPVSVPGPANGLNLRIAWKPVNGRASVADSTRVGSSAAATGLLDPETSPIDSLLGVLGVVV